MRTETGTTTATGTKRREKEIITTRHNKQKTEVARNLRNGKITTARNNRQTAIGAKERIGQETTTIMTGTEDKTRNGITRTGDLKEGRTQNVRKPQNVHSIRSVRKDRNVLSDRKETSIKRDRKIMKSLLRNSLCCWLFVSLVTACNEHTVYHSYQPLPIQGWVKSDTLSFSLSLTDTVPSTLRLFAEVRNQSDYPYHDLYLFVSQNLQDSTVWRTDTLAIHLADSTGKWIGNGWGSIYQTEKLVRSVLLPYPGNYTLKIRHGMKDDMLTGLSDIGIRVEK